MEKFNFDYSQYSDILHIHKNNQLTKGSVEIGDFTLDFGNKDEIVGIEIEHASEFFSNVDINKESLKVLKNANFVVDKRNPRCQIIFIKLEFPTVIKKVPMPLPIVS
ncbi:DUF2283 domain-containing protein [Candidatus Woesearchaeota archaeon]|nr:DUF2283 domain-containing protein [Candidatus Woesearchaeota archaeon]